MHTLHIPDAAHKVCVTFGVVGFVVHEGVHVEGVSASTVLLAFLTIVSPI